ncbi:MAG: glycoside hydrolase family 19 protein [Planctomycetota bacterium]
MCIGKSVGEKGGNEASDVKIVQALLNLDPAMHAAGPSLIVDGKVGRVESSKTIKRIRYYQERVVKLKAKNIDGKVDPLPRGTTLRTLGERVPSAFTEMKLRGIMPRGDYTDPPKYYVHLAQAMQAHGINTPLRVAHFLAQVAHECMDLKFPEEASGVAYEGRKETLGNTEKGDGHRFRGRGLLHLTGRRNYTFFGEYAGMNLLDGTNPGKVASDPKLAVDSAVWYWTKLKPELNSFADKDDIRAVTFVVNGGYNGLNLRKRSLARAKFFLRLP